MAVKLRLARHGTRGRPFYWIVAANSTASRNGAFIEKLGTYDPLLPRDSGSRINLQKDAVAKWLSVGAIPTERVMKLFEISGVALPKKIKEAKERRANAKPSSNVSA